DRVQEILNENIVVATDLETYEEIIGDPAIVERIRSEHLGSGATDEDDDGGATDDEDSDSDDEPSEE
ncbi:MAG TPA: hypothetical protein VK116_11345, partial [Planctomycetota bacterium]|nr:hypothetical protein [Planctomycetota bacterium]